eukprot:scaffold4942_cov417-Prasinococcus_capsulatus_cf.AAC.2
MFLRLVQLTNGQGNYVPRARGHNKVRSDRVQDYAELVSGPVSSGPASIAATWASVTSAWASSTISFMELGRGTSCSFPDESKGLRFAYSCSFSTTFTTVSRNTPTPAAL